MNEEKVNIVKYLKTKGMDFTVREETTNFTVLMKAVLDNSDIMVDALLGIEYEKNKAISKVGKPFVDVHAQDSLGRTALHLAVKPSEYGSLQNYDIIETLLINGCNPLATDKKGLNVFDYAINNPAVYELLLQYAPNGKPNKSAPLNLKLQPTVIKNV
jgi:ankyrin repeat protein